MGGWEDVPALGSCTMKGGEAESLVTAWHWAKNRIILLFVGRGGWVGGWVGGWAVRVDRWVGLGWVGGWVGWGGWDLHETLGFGAHQTVLLD